MTDQDELDRINEQLEVIEEQKELAIRGNHNYLINFGNALVRGLDARPITQIWQDLPVGRGQILQGVPQLFDFGAVYGDGSRVVSISFMLSEESEPNGETIDLEDTEEPTSVPQIPSISHPMLE